MFLGLVGFYIIFIWIVHIFLIEIQYKKIQCNTYKELQL